MKITFIKIIEESKEILLNIAFCTIYSCETLVYYHDQDCDRRLYIRKQGEWSYVEQDFALESITFAERKRLIALEEQFIDTRSETFEWNYSGNLRELTTEDHRRIADVLNDIIAKFSYVDNNYDDFIIIRFDELTKKERKRIINNYKEDDADWKDKAGWQWFSEIRSKYRNAIRNGTLVNNQELEPYGLSTQALIDSLLYEKERTKAYDEHCKQLRESLGLSPLKENECDTNRTNLYMKSAYL